MSRRRELWPVALAGALLFLPGLGGRDLWNPDEARYAVVARNMLDGGDWLIPRLNGEIYTQKPPLFFQAIATASLPAGRVTETSARLPSALAAIAALLLVFDLGRRLFGRRAAWLSAAAFATCTKIVWQGRFGQIDMLLTALVAAAVWCWLRGYLENRPRLYPAFFVLTGIATISKGPVGLLPPLLAILAFLALTRDRVELGRLRLGRGLLLWAAVVLIWLVPALIAGGGGYFDALVVRQTVTRYANPWHHRQPFYYYLTVLPADFFPWSLLLPAAVVVGWRRIAGGWRPWRRPATVGEPVARATAQYEPAAVTAAAAGEPVAERAVETADAADVPSAERPRRGFLFALCWVVVTLLFFSLSAGKRTVYVLTMYPALALLTGAGLDRLETAWRAARDPRSDRAAGGPPPTPNRAWLLIPYALLVALLLVAAIAVPVVGPRRPELALLGAPFLWTLETVVVTLLAAAVVGLAAARRRRVLPGAVALTAAMAFLTLAAAYVLLPRFDAFKSARPLSSELLSRAAPDEPYGIYPRLDNTFLFYTHRHAVELPTEAAVRAFLARPTRTWLLIQRNDLEQLDRPLDAVEVARDLDPREGYLLLTRPPYPDD